MEITVVGRASQKREAEVGELHFRVQFEGQDRAEAVEKARRAGAAIQEFAGRPGSATPAGTTPQEDGTTPRLVVDALRTHSWTPTSMTGEVMPEHWNASVGMHYRAPADRMQQMVDHVGDQGGVQLDSLHWQLTDATRDAARAEVLAAAVADAIARAQAMADAAGGGTVEIVQLADPGLLGTPGQGTPQPFGSGGGPEMARMARDSAAAFTSGLTITLEPDTLEITEWVHARFRA